jgi:APA family basic amino acid/polyamine antiporter
VLVSLGVLILRKKEPTIHRPFRTPAAPVVSILGAAICTLMIVAIDVTTLASAALWMVLGLVVYFAYSRKRSKLRSFSNVLPTADDFESRK